MYAKLLIKGAVLLLVINVALIGVITSRLARLAVAIFNLIALFVLLFQERSAFQTTSSPTSPAKRILFTSDVFGRISIGIGCIVWGLAAYWGLVVPPLLVGILGGGLFYLLTVALFDLTEDGFWGASSVRVVGTVVILIVLAVVAQRAGLVSLNGIGKSYDSMVMWRQRTLQSIVIDKEVGLPPQPEEDELIIIPTPASGDEQLPENDTGALLTGSVVFPIDEGIPGDRIFRQADRSQEGSLTFATFLPVLFETFNIARSTNNYTFPTVSESNQLYPSFVLARDYNMIGNNTSPDTVISCQTLMVLLGLVQEWDLDYTSSTVLDVFRAEGVKKGYTSYGCDDRTAPAQRTYLP